jgi:mycothiol synthase
MPQTLRAAVIGLGYGRQHAATYQALPGVEVACLCDADEAKLETAARAHPGISTKTDWREVARDPSIDLVSVCTPDHLHFEQAAAMVLSGKHVMGEKPMTTRLVDALVLRRLVREMGVTFGVGNVSRFLAQFGLVARYAREGRLGELFLVEANYIHDMRPVFARTPWRADPARPQLAIFGGGVHPVDLVRWVAGEVVEVFALGNHKAVPEYPSADNVLLSMKFASGCLGKVWITFGIRRSPENVIELNAFGTQGTIYADSQAAQARLYLAGIAEGQYGWATIPFKATEGHPIAAELADFVAAIRAGRAPKVDVVDGARTVAVLEAAQRSLELGRPVAVEDLERPLTHEQQLQMRRPHLEDLPAVSLPDGYSLRTYRPGDERAWLEICNPAIGMGWDEAELRQKLLDIPWFAPERLFFVCYDGEPVGTACAWQRSAGEREEGYVHMVAVKPEHRGHKLGLALTLRVLRALRRYGFRQSILNTDDHRLPAIAVYRDLGFEPEVPNEHFRQRWAAVQAVMGPRFGIGGALLGV